MGIFARVAAKGEARTMAVVEEAITTLTNLDHGSVNLPCHITSETHAGIWVGSKDDDGKLWVGVYRCQQHFWGVELPEGVIQRAKRGEDVLSWLMIGKLQGLLQVSDFGRMDSGGAPNLVLGLAGIDYK